MAGDDHPPARPGLRLLLLFNDVVAGVLISLCGAVMPVRPAVGDELP